MNGTLDVIYDLEELKHSISRSSFVGKGETLWRYSDVLPIGQAAKIPPLSVGWTPLYRNEKLASEFGVAEFYIKDDGRNPTGSLKDRASAVAVAKALELDTPPIVACASTGNAASSLSGFAAVAGLKSCIFVPESAPAAKVTQLMVYGANVVLVKGDYSDAFNLAAAAIQRFGWYNRNCAINPYLVEGKKTCALEIAEQSGWDVPDRVFISVGDGCCIGGLYKGFSDLLSLRLIEKMPKIVGVQADGAQPIFEAFKRGSERVEFGAANTIADSISVGAPRNWAKALRAVRKSNGDIISVNDDEILAAIPQMARASGVFAEPAGAAAFAGAKRMAMDGKLSSNERIAVVVTGNGLKDIKSAQKSVHVRPLECEPDIEKFASMIQGRFFQ